MPQNSPEVLTFITALVISAVSGAISIMNRLVKGHKGGLLWAISEFMASVLCGCLAWDAYSQVIPYMPDWVPQPAFVAAAAYASSRLLQILGNLFTVFLSGVKPPPGDNNA